MSKSRGESVASGAQQPLKRPLVSAAEPNPANWRIVHNRDRYMEA